MIVKAIFKNENYNYFRDVEAKEQRKFGDIFECNDNIAKKRIEKGLVVKATDEEIAEYLKKQEEVITEVHQKRNFWFRNKGTVGQSKTNENFRRKPK